jgi:hypothetical protein
MFKMPAWHRHRPTPRCLMNLIIVAVMLVVMLSLAALVINDSKDLTARRKLVRETRIRMLNYSEIYSTAYFDKQQFLLDWVFTDQFMKLSSENKTSRNFCFKSVGLILRILKPCHRHSDIITCCTVVLAML